MDALANTIDSGIHDNILLDPNDIPVNICLRKIRIITRRNVPFLRTSLIGARELTTFRRLIRHDNFIRDGNRILI